MIPIDREFILLLFSVNNNQLDLLDSHENLTQPVNMKDILGENCFWNIKHFKLDVGFIFISWKYIMLLMII